MTDSNSLSEVLADLRAKASAAGRARYDALVKNLIDSGAIASALKVGDGMPVFQLATAEGRLARLQDILSNGPAVFSFYRGVWCPYCSAELNALAEIAPDIRKAGATLVAVTPEAGGAALRTKTDRKLDFEILCDLDNALAMECGLVFLVPEEIRAAYRAANIDFPKIYGNDSWLLPTPATYIVGRDGIIAHAYVNPDFRHRLEPGDILTALSRIPR